MLGGKNCYRYAPNPIEWIDPFGLMAKEPNCSKKVRNVDAIAEKHGGVKIGENRYKMPDRKSAQQAASEISGDLGSNPTTIRRKEYIDANNTYQQNQSNRVIGKHSASGNAGYHDHSIGHSRFGETRPHFNAWSESTGTTAKDNVHLYY
ncbi:hypothetical protein [Marinibactrum halimedae]|uniref:hypothetical protein n=1 Tax=Marinibactrum halimedae TaxID=1444977 RepID=UPI001E36A4FA|nr:hypothetical protein [Marinibactrum halimedae]